MNIWIINHYATTEYFNKGGRPYSLSKYMKKAGNEVAVFCASTVHCTGDQLVEIKEGLFSEIVPESNVPHVFVKCRSYKGNGKKRILNMIDFYKNVERVALSYGNKNGKPDVIIGSSVHPLACIVAIKLAKRYGVKAVAEIRDLWPESLIAYGVVRANNPVVFFLRKLEKWIYKKSDAIIFTMEGAYNYILDRKWENSIPNSKVFFVNNGVDLIDFDSNLRKYQIDDNDLNNSDIHKVVYTGSVRKVNEVSILIEVAKKNT